MKTTLPFLLSLCLLIVCISGCTTTPDVPEPAPIPTPTPTPEPAPPESPVIILPPELSSVIVKLDAAPLDTEPALMLQLEMDARQAPGTLPSAGYPMMLTFFTYNIDRAPAGFSPGSADEVRASGIPYKTRSIHIYPDNIITHREQVPEMGSSPNIFNSELPYVYGVVIELRQQIG
ncbi:hypothetical protein RJ53_06835 [Methanocalculus chunghsingensis]|uniref:Uncharacterized protein n=1 Tax=Methanocalculus chunghsingensis TaxID=156457 RepID=A0A8J7W6H6_9EURY|nr:hypothetical protein [Methanocalculus chunghsingensis]MBR1369224.1 hypothetical protein [Methanocalculus chunghsingensis]